MIKNCIKESIETKKKILENDEIVDTIQKIIDEIVLTIKSGGKVLFAGNGGSAADAQHFAAELVGRFYLERKAMAALALSVDTSIITAIANDYSYNDIFSKQVEGLGKKGDVFFGISTSGNSKNIIEAVNKAKEIGMKTISLLGKDGGKLKEISDISIVVPSQITPRIQETHMMIGHIICEMVESTIFA